MVSSGPTFEALQERLHPTLGAAGASDLSSGTLVVLSSITFPAVELRKIPGILRYEERMLCLLWLLERADLHITYVTSLPIDEAVIEYYLSFLDDPSGAEKRLSLVSLGDPGILSLTGKLLANQAALRAVSESIEGDAVILPFNVTDEERRLSEALGIPLFGPHPDRVALGSKSGSRAVAAAAGVPVPEGAADLYSLELVEDAIRMIRGRSPGCRAVVVKLNNGFSGQGNAIVDVDEGFGSLTDRNTTFCAESENWPSFGQKIQAEGAVVEELIRGPNVVSPSVQMRILADGSFEVVSTHDQILGGPDDQVYLGCRFPADPSYRKEIRDHGIAIARQLSSRRVVGSFGVDFVGDPDDRFYLTEINLRLGGTTHPFLAARVATSGDYDVETGELVVDDGTRSYVATDNLKQDSYKGLRPQDVIGSVDRAGIGFDRTWRRGVLLHLLGALSEHGKLGATCVGLDREDAEFLLDRLTEELNALR